MKIKKIIAALLIFLSLFFVVSCDGNKSQNETSKPASVVKTTNKPKSSTTNNVISSSNKTKSDTNNIVPTGKTSESITVVDEDTIKITTAKRPTNVTASINPNHNTSSYLTSSIPGTTNITSTTNVISTATTITSATMPTTTVPNTPIFSVVYDRSYINSNNITFKYSTGNYQSFDNLEFYRATLLNNDTENFVELLPKPNYKLGALGSSVYNIRPFSGISYIAITYKTESNAKLYYSADNSFTNSKNLAASSDYSKLYFQLDDAKYFKIEASTSSLYIKSIEIALDDIDAITSPLTYNGFRVNPLLLGEETLVSGETTKKVPVIKYEDAEYKIVEYKEYTYYNQKEWLTYYNENHQVLDYDKSVLTDPVDVANYYLLFNTWPVNYFPTSEAKSYYKSGLIKSDLRCVQQFSRTDGYVRSVPLNMNNGDVLYYELDLKLSNSYTPSNRDVGRLVVFTNGFNATGYNLAPVIVYTDDHYATFKEYNNAGSFLERFNAERQPTPYVWNNVYTYDYIKN